MREPTPDDLRSAVMTVNDALTPYVEADWSVNAGDLEWTCRETLDHSINVLLGYAGNLSMLTTMPRQEVRDGDANGSILRLLDALVSSGHILARVAEATPPGGLGYHAAGRADGA